MKTRPSVLGMLWVMVALGCMAQNNTYPWPSSGNVGIGTTNPSNPLTVIGSNNPEQIGIQTTSSGGHSWAIASFGTYSGFNAGGFGIADYTAGSWRMYLDGSGNVGIGTTSPSAPLQIEAGNDGASGQTNCGAESATCPASSASGYGVSLDSDYSSGQYRWRWEPIDRGGNISLYVQEAHATANSYSNVVRFGWNQFDPSNSFAVFGNTYLGGNVGIGTTTPGQKLEVSGNILLSSGSGGSITYADGTTQTTAWTGSLCGGDYAESVDVAGDRHRYGPGDVLEIDDKDPSRFAKVDEPYSRAVAGVFSTKPGALGRRQTTPRSPDEVPLAMIGIVPVKVTAENGPIRPRDLLVSSSTPGYAMKGTDNGKLVGAVIGKAMGSLDKGQGVIEVLVTLQ